jgi:hypothetical protein
MLMHASTRFAVAVLVVFVSLGSSAAHAQMSPGGSTRLLSFGLGGGVSVPVSDASDAFKSGVNGQGFVAFNLPGLPIRPRLDVTFQRFDLKHAEVAGPALPGGDNGSVLAGVANVQVPLLKGAFRPYVVAGLGAYNVKAGDTSKTQFGVNGGAGVTLKLSAISLYLEGRLDNVFTDQGVIDAKSIQIVPVTFGVVF